ncbi:MAG: GH92 family glycosyl hydrolase [Candidatus Marinimicrobia bacterium]|nr:GH92 family glycosyl hydrolase [Candidatus Neomarinimicrobiota bacterium]
MRANWLIIILIISLFISFTLIGCARKKTYNYTQYVNPIIGTGVYSMKGAMGNSNTFPGAALPHGMVQLSPDTGPHIAGYLHSDSTIQGFSHTHLSGTGCWGLGNFLVMPITGAIKTTEEEYCAKFDRDSEVAKPGYYAVKLNDYNIVAELTVTKRTGLHKYTFPEDENSHILFDVTHNLADDDPLNADVEIINNNQIAGSITIPNPFCGGKTPYTVYFSALTSKSFDSFGTWNGNKITEDSRTTTGANIGCYIDFATSEQEEILIKVGVSFVSKEQALLNVKEEIPNWDFAKIKEQADNIWNEKLNKIQVEGGIEEDKIKFYTAIYHTLLGPYTASDVNGKYKGMDHKIHTVTDHTYYHVYSLWDTFRSEHPLLNLIEPEQQNEMIQTLLDKQREGGWLPKWEFANRYTNCMVADHATSIIAESYLKGIRNYDTEKAYQAMRKNSVSLPGRGDIKVISKSADFIPLKLYRDGKARTLWKTGDETKELEFDWKFKYNDMKWHNFLMKYDQDAKLQVFIDGEQVTESDEEVPAFEEEEPWRIGVHRINDKSGLYYTGQIGQIGIYNRALNNEEIDKLANKEEITKNREIYFSNKSQIPSGMNIGGDAEFEQNEFGSSIIFDGIDDLVEIDDPESINSEVTLSLWFKTSAPTDFQGRCGLDYYNKSGYIPHDIEWGGWGSVSTTLEDCYNDFCIARVAKAMGKTEDYSLFRKRAGFYKNLYDQNSGFMRPRNKDGSWKKPFAPQEWEGFTEGNSWSYSWFVPHDVPGLMELMGKAQFIEKLDHLFSNWAYPKWDEHFSTYWHGNEPSQQVPYYYNYAEQPWKTQKVVDAIMNDLYGIEANGIPGNEDVGQLSAWFVLSAMGFHPVAPAECTYMIGRPLFDKITIHLNDKYYNAEKFTIQVNNNSRENKYIQSLSINGKDRNRSWFDHELIKNGGEIILEMGPEPNENWGTQNYQTKF